jgi:hypothetical protein
MNLFRVIFDLFLFYLLYKVVFDFIIPVYNTTKKVKKQFGEMQHKMDEMNRQQQANQYSSKVKEPAPKSKSDDYIDFEEIK